MVIAAINLIVIVQGHATRVRPTKKKLPNGNAIAVATLRHLVIPTQLKIQVDGETMTIDLIQTGTMIIRGMKEITRMVNHKPLVTTKVMVFKKVEADGTMTVNVVVTADSLQDCCSTTN